MMLTYVKAAFTLQQSYPSLFWQKSSLLGHRGMKMAAGENSTRAFLFVLKIVACKAALTGSS